MKDTPIEEVSRVLDKHPGSALPVFDSNKSFIGVVTQESLLHVLLQKHDHLLKLTQQMKSVVQEINRTRDLRLLLRVALRKTLDMMGLKTGWIFLFDEEGSRPRLVAHVNLPKQYSKERQAALRGSCTCQQKILRQKEKLPILCLKCERSENLGLELKYHITIPLLCVGRPLGLMNLASQEAPVISNEEITLLTTLGKNIGTAIMNAQSFRKLEAERQRLVQWSRRLSQLHEAGTRLLGLLGTSVIEDSLLQEGLESICTLVKAKYGAIGLLDSRGQLARFFHTGLSKTERARLKELPEGKGILGIMGKESQTLRLKDLTKHPSACGFPPHHPVMKTFLGVPISFNGAVYGRIYLTEKAGGRPFTREDEKVVLTFAQNLAMTTENAHLLRELANSEKKYRTLTESSLDGIYIIQDEKLKYANPALLKMLRYDSAKELVGKSIWEISAPEYHNLIKDKIRQRLEGKVNSVQYAFEAITKNSERIWMEVLGTVTEFESRPAVLDTARDVTQRKLIEEVEQRFRAVLDQSHEALFLSEVGSWRFLDVNDTACASLGYSKKELLRLTVPEIDPLFPEEKMREILKQLQKEPNNILGPLESMHRTKDGRHIPVEITVKLAKVEGREILMAVARDITERKQAEKALRIRARQQSVVATLGQQALTGLDLSELMEQAVHLVAETLKVEFCKVLELLPDGHALLLRAGVGWHEGYAAHATVGAGNDSQAGYTLRSNRPVIVEDLCKETRFSGSPLLHEHGIVSGISVIIAGRERPFGVLGVYTTRYRKFSEDDIHFLQAVANVIANAIERKLFEESLSKLSSAVEQAADNVFITNRDGVIEYVNPAFEKLTGYTKKEALGKTPSILKSGKQGKQFYNKLWKIILSGKVFNGILINKKKNGELYYEEKTITPIRDNQGNITHFVSTGKDITERVRNEKIQSVLFQISEATSVSSNLEDLLQIVHQQLGTLMDTTNFYVALYDEKTGTYSLPYCVDEYEEKEVTPQQLRKSLTDYVRRTGLPLLADAKLHQELIEKGEVELVDTPSASWLGVPLKTAQGIIGVVAIQSYSDTTLYSEKDLELLNFVSGNIAMAIERKQAEGSLLMLKRAVEQSIDGIAVVDMDGIIQYTNQAWAKMHGYDVTEPIGKHKNIFHTQKQLHKEVNPFMKYMRKTKSEANQGEVGHVTKDGRTFPTWMTITRLKDRDGNPIGFVSSARDISEQKKTEKELKKSRKQLRRLSAHLQSVIEQERSRIAREIHDELGQALSILQINLAWLEKRLGKDKKKCVEKIKSMSKLVDTTLDQVQSLARELRPSVLDHLGLVAAIEWQAHEFEKHTGIQCRVNLMCDEIELNQDYATAIFRIFQEALTNVARHSRARSVKANLEEKGNKLILQITDNGKGITQQQINNSKSMGLIGMKERVNLMKGKFSIKRIANKGTTLTISIPLNNRGEADD
jgi:PAS domain S-box-containing protein